MSTAVDVTSSIARSLTDAYHYAAVLHHDDSMGGSAFQGDVWVDPWANGPSYDCKVARLTLALAIQRAHEGGMSLGGLMLRKRAATELQASGVRLAQYVREYADKVGVNVWEHVE